MKKLFNDIYSFVLPLPFNGTPEMTLYFIDGDKPVIIDTGLGDPESIDSISSELAKIGRKIADISMIINTHEHIEHFGGDNRLREISGAKVLASEAATYKIENSQKINNNLKKHLLYFDRNLTEELRAELDFDLVAEEAKVDGNINNGDIIDTGTVKLKVIATPGHSPGHVCLYNEENKVLFTGDHVIEGGSTFVGYDYREIASQRIVDTFNIKYGEPDNLSLYIGSLKNLESLELGTILPSHGDPIINPHYKISQEKKKKERRANMFLNAMKNKNEIALKELTTMVYGRRCSSFLYRGSTLGYLAMLNRSGIIEASMKKDDLYLRLKPGV